MTSELPIVDYLVLDEVPYLRANACVSCGALFFDRRNACARCGKREFGQVRLSEDGHVRAFTIVHRAAVPYVSVVVELNEMGFVKANLVGVTEADQITPDLAVTLTTFSLGFDDDGTEAVGFGFRPKLEGE